MDGLLREYLPILVFLAIATGLALVIVTTSYIVARQKPDVGKLSPYECGFPPFNDARRQFDVRFYLVAILFIIFDLEVAFLFPWAISLKSIGMLGFWSMMGFLGILTITQQGEDLSENATLILEDQFVVGRQIPLTGSVQGGLVGFGLHGVQVG